MTLANPVLLILNSSYTIGYRSANGGELDDARFVDNPGVSSEVTIPDGGFGLRHSFDNEPLSTDFATQMPTMNLGDTDPLTGPNMQFTDFVPEPASAAIVTIGAIALARRKHGRLLVD